MTPSELAAGTDMATPAAPQDAVPAAGLLRPGVNCWRLAEAGRATVIVDAADYFAAAKKAMLRARHQILVIGWDFDNRIRLEPRRTRLRRVPNQLGRFLTRCVARKQGLRVHVLKWRLGMLAALLRGMTPLFILNWLAAKRLSYRLAADHPLGASHHQKLIVIDDALAFCGGIDMTADRWDTREHKDRDPRRRRPSGLRYPPHHDAAMMVDGEAARALGELARARWLSATGETLPVPPGGSDPWPPCQAPQFHSVPIAIARTMPAYGARQEIREVERLYLDLIRGARRCLYIEAQYFAARRIAKALAERLGEPDPPEIVLVNPVESHGWLEEHAMFAARRLLLSTLQAADHAHRLRIYSPVTAAGTMIYVHSKVIVADDRVLRMGSSNLNNRSMGLDTECDLALEAVPGRPDEAAVRQGILDVRDGLLAEHLGVALDMLRQTLARSGSLIATIETLRQRPGRTLQPSDSEHPTPAEAFIVENELLDPEHPDSFLARLFGRIDWRWRRRLQAKIEERRDRLKQAAARRASEAAKADSQNSPG